MISRAAMGSGPAFLQITAVACVLAVTAACGSHASDTSTQSSTTTTSSSTVASPSASTDASPMASPIETPSASPTTSVGYTDLNGVFGADKIEQLAAIGAFGTPSASFNPNQPIQRRTFAVWLFDANNAIQSNDEKKIHPALPDEKPAFHDLPATDPDFAKIQGLQSSGISVGFPDGTFKPNQPITREQAVSTAALLGCDYRASFTGGNLSVGYSYLPDWKDKHSVSKTYVPVLAGCSSETDDIVGRTYGKITVFHPTETVTRAEAALMMWKINGRSAADAAKPSPTP